ncbi:MAG TPA: VWA domain-containing protein [Acidobacteriaceae bacterium]|nr:VWA domain-containing protein [Acidobacteriaceae bacterium]
MRVPVTLAVLLLLTVAAPAQTAPATPPAQPDQAPSTTLTVRSNLVEVPVLVTTKSGQIVFALTARDFTLTDDGVPQRISLVPDTGSQPLALAVVVETGGAGAHHLANYEELGPILDAIIGNIPHRVSLIAFDSTPHLIQPFTTSTDDVANELANLRPGDPGASILDAVAYAVTQLRAQPGQYRRAILLLSETVDQGSNTTLNAALRLISNTNTAVYSFAFSSTTSAVKHEASKFSRPDEPGPAHGCFSRQGADAEYKGHYSKQVLDCISDLAPPLRFATMAFLAAHSALRNNTAESIARLTGGEFFRFKNPRTLQRALLYLWHDLPNYYVLSFTPTSPTPGLHALRLDLKDYSQLRVQYRPAYWIDEAAAN